MEVSYLWRCVRCVAPARLVIELSRSADATEATQRTVHAVWHVQPCCGRRSGLTPGGDHQRVPKAAGGLLGRWTAGVWGLGSGTLWGPEVPACSCRPRVMRPAGNRGCSEYCARAAAGCCSMHWQQQASCVRLAASKLVNLRVRVVFCCAGNNNLTYCLHERR